MKIYTKTGDKGTTALFGGTRVPKHHLRIESYGTIDELNSYIGLVKDQAIDENTKNILIKIQHDLFTLGSMLATPIEKETLNDPFYSSWRTYNGVILSYCKMRLQKSRAISSFFK